MRTEFPDGTTVIVRDGLRQLWRDSLLLNQRDATAEELAEQTATETVAANTDLILNRLEAALAANLEYLALSPPTQAQVVAQVRLLTREVNGIIRYIRGDLTTTEGTE